ncbi:MAG: 8-amino-7-oxononanoate synthase [Pirellulales bacterium]|nr:8-amino-7-oxononanoate synthase [Pirellulales bacterium]
MPFDEGMPELDAVLQARLIQLERRQRHRQPISGQRFDGVYVKRDGKSLVSFSCNDYLGLAQHPEVTAAAHDALDRYGSGAGASRLVTGNHPLYERLESELAQLKGAEDACVFGSGYLANLGVISALVGPNDLILADKYIHACMLDGAKLSQATLKRFAHNNIEHCRRLLTKYRPTCENCLILTETVFSMDGDRAQLDQLSELAGDNDAWLMTDDAHGLAIVTSAPTDVMMGTLSKAAGSYGGYVAGTRQLVDFVKGTARSLIYSTALPPATIAASIAAIKVMQREPQRGERALALAKLFSSRLELRSAESAIVPVIVRDEKRALDLSAMLEANGYLVTAIRPPTVPESTSRLRFTFSMLHDETDVQSVADLLKEHLACEL